MTGGHLPALLLLIVLVPIVLVVEILVVEVVIQIVDILILVLQKMPDARRMQMPDARRLGLAHTSPSPLPVRRACGV